MERSTQRLGRALVVIVNDRVVHGENDDKTGPLVTELLEETGFIVDGTVAVAGEMVDIRNALNTAVIGGVDLVVTVGGTGVSPRDVTPDATLGVLDRAAERGLIDLTSAVAALRQTNFRIDPSLLDQLFASDRSRRKE